MSTRFNSGAVFYQVFIADVSFRLVSSRIIIFPISSMFWLNTVEKKVIFTLFFFFNVTLRSTDEKSFFETFFEDFEAFDKLMDEVAKEIKDVITKIYLAGRHQCWENPSGSVWVIEAWRNSELNLIILVMV